MTEDQKRDAMKREIAERLAAMLELADAASTSSGGEIVLACVDLATMLLRKNAAYGDSALNPVRIFSKADPIEQLLVRLDDKLSRLARGSAAGEDVELDAMGYLVLIRVARMRLAGGSR